MIKGCIRIMFNTILTALHHASCMSCDVRYSIYRVLCVFKPHGFLACSACVLVIPAYWYIPLVAKKQLFSDHLFLLFIYFFRFFLLRATTTSGSVVGASGNRSDDSDLLCITICRDVANQLTSCFACHKVIS